MLLMEERLIQLGFLVLMPVLYGALYASYKDIFLG